jgi:hypothetical protein
MEARLMAYSVITAWKIIRPALTQPRLEEALIVPVAPRTIIAMNMVETQEVWVVLK